MIFFHASIVFFIALMTLAALAAITWDVVHRT